MLAFDDKRWTELKGGYGAPFDPRQFLLGLESGANIQACWEELWKGLYHQGNVGEASYAAVPHLVRIYINSGRIDWNTYGIVSTIELARNVGSNPDVPQWLRREYEDAIGTLAMTGLSELQRATNPEVIRSILSIIAIWKGSRVIAKFIIELTDDEWNELEKREF